MCLMWKNSLAIFNEQFIIPLMICFPMFKLLVAIFTSNSLVNHVRDAGCSLLYDNVKEFRDIIKCLPFFPTEMVVSIYEEIIMPKFSEHKDSFQVGEPGKEESYGQQVLAFKDYFEKNWIGSTVRNKKRKSPTGALDKWVKYESIVEEDMVLTNNGNEVFNSSWNPSIPKSASVWTVIECFMNEETLCRLVHSELLRNVHQSHNLTRAQTHAAKMKEI